MKTATSCCIAVLLFSAPVAQASEPGPFEILYRSNENANASAKNAPLHRPVSLGSVPSPVRSVMYGRRTPDGDYVTYCQIKHDHSALESIGDDGRRPRARR